jgi:hypothetical protein
MKNYNLNKITKKYLITFYVHKRYSIPKLANLLKCGNTKIRYNLIKHNIPRRTNSESHLGIKRTPQSIKKSTQNRLKKWVYKINKCHECNKIIPLQRIRCPQCHKKFLKGKIGLKNPNFKNAMKLCIDCGKKIGYIKTKLRCKLCENIHRRGKNSPLYIHGNTCTKYSSSFTTKLKDFIRKRDNNKCQHCQINNYQHHKKYGHNLTIHHIDYNKFNSVHTNLITLCHSCNSKANFNRDYWFAYYTWIINK